MDQEPKHYPFELSKLKTDNLFTIGVISRGFCNPKFVTETKEIECKTKISHDSSVYGDIVTSLLQTCLPQVKKFLYKIENGTLEEVFYLITEALKQCDYVIVGYTPFTKLDFVEETFFKLLLQDNNLSKIYFNNSENWTDFICEQTKKQKPTLGWQLKTKLKIDFCNCKHHAPLSSTKYIRLEYVQNVLNFLFHIDNKNSLLQTLFLNKE